MKNIAYSRFLKLVASTIVVGSLFQGVASAKDLAEEKELKCIAFAKVALNVLKLQMEYGAAEKGSSLRGMMYENINNNVFDLIEKKYINKMGVSKDTVDSAFRRNTEKETTTFIDTITSDALQDSTKTKSIADYFYVKLTKNQCDKLAKVKLIRLY